jgi:LuxR family transcriptional regulator, maltose regulon positive regulatory protein
MTEAIPFSSALNASVTNEQLLVTKLHIPHPRSSLVTRPRLFNRLNEGLTHKLILISAPPGFGKTTILCDWISQSPCSFSWVSLDTNDNESSRFWTYFIAAIQRWNPKLGDQALTWLQSSPSIPIEAILTTLLNEIDAFSGSFAIVLEDYHTIDSLSIHQNLTFLIDHMPSNMHVIITSRSDPQLPLAQYRATNEMVEIRSEDLRFTSEEIDLFLNQTMGLGLTFEQIASLESRTEGWIAGLQLAALSMRGHKDHSGFISSFAGSHRFILDYLIEQVLQRQTTDIQEFLLNTSILTRFTAPLCDAITGRNDSQTILEHLDRANLFLVSLDDERIWFRYHHLFADALQSLLRSNQVPHSTELHRRAAKWYETQNMISDAIDHALLASDWEQAVRMIEQVGMPIANQKKAQTVLGWSSLLPDFAFISHPRLQIIKALAWMFIKRFDDSRNCLESVEKIILTSSDRSTDEMRVLLGETASMHSVLSRLLGNIPECVTFANKALELIPESDLLLRSSVLPNAALAFLISGDMRLGTEAALLQSNQTANRLNFRYVKLRGFRLLGWYYALKGSLKTAANTYRNINRVVNGPDELADVFGSPGYYFGMGDILIEWNDLKSAEDHIGLGLKLIKETDALDADILSLGYQSAARLKQAMGDTEGAIQILREFEQIARQNHFFTPLVTRCVARQVLLGQFRGNTTAASEWILNNGLTIDDDPYYPGEAEYLIYARYLIHQGKISQGLSLLERWLEDAELKERMRSVIEILILRSRAFKASSHFEEAIKTIAKAINHAEPEGYIRIFVDEGAEIAELLAETASRGVSPDYIHHILAAFPQDQIHLPPHSLDPTPNSTRLVDPLSRREIEVLNLINSGASNQTIAHELVISVATVKRHISNIYSKLQVTSRTQVIAKAREFGIL